MMKRIIALTSVCLITLAASGLLEANDAYLVRNLVSDIPDLADHTDPNLVGAWGISESATSPFWIADAGTGFSTLYDSSGNPIPLVVTIPASKGGGPTGTPTGTVFNGTPGFLTAAAAKTTPFLFATLDGAIAGWSPAIDRTHAKIMVDNSAAGAEYTGLAMGTVNSSAYLYAANFHAGTIDVFDSNYAPVNMAGGFRDPAVPAGYAPFNIQNLGGNLYVAFAQQNSSQSFAVSGAGLGYVDIFAPNGVLMQHLIAKGALNAPWGLAIAPAGFGDFANDLLVGNFGDGTINVFNPSTGAYIATLNDSIGAPITIPNLWALQPGNGASGGDANAIYFTAGIPGPDNGNHGLFGRLQAAPQLTATSVTNAANAQGGIAPNTWITLKGPNLAETTRQWNAGDFVNGALPVELDGVRVNVNGKPAYVYYISPTQINALTQAATATGPAQVQVNNNGLLSGIVSVQVQALAPAFFNSSDGKHIAATHADGSIVGPSGPPPDTASPAKPGETIVLYGTGFGPTNPPVGEGTVVGSALPLNILPTVTIGGTVAQVIFAGVSSAGVDQINVIVPATAPNGDVPVMAQIGGVTSPVTLIPVQQ